VIPAPDPIALPAPLPLLTSLLILTFLLHILAMNVTLGGTVIAAASDLWGRFRGSERHRELARNLFQALPIAVAMTVTLGVAPLLFLQVIYGQLFYTSSIIMAWPWLSVFAVVIVAYYGIYLYAWGGEFLGQRRVWVGVGSALLFLAVAFLFTNNMVLMLTPERWTEIYHEHRTGLWLNVSDATVAPRVLHMIGAAIAGAGLFTVLYGLYLKRNEAAEQGRWVARYGAGWFIGATLAQAGTGPWLLFRLPERVREGFTGTHDDRTILLAAGMAVGLLALLTMTTVMRARNPLPVALPAGLLFVATVAIMAMVRHLVRDDYLQPQFQASSLQVDSQVALIVIFFVLLVGALGAVGYMLRAVLLARPHA
jgi:hypothetical protein